MIQLSSGWHGLIVLLAFALPAVAADMPAEAFAKRPLSEKLGTPRQTLETLCFALDAYEHIPAMIADAVSCLDINTKKDGYVHRIRRVARGSDERDS